MREWTQEDKGMHAGTHVPLCVNLCWRTHETDEYEAQASKAHHSQKEKTPGDSANTHTKAFSTGPEQEKPPTAQADEEKPPTAQADEEKPPTAQADG